MVYGTLKSGHGNNRLLKTAKFIGQCLTVDKFVLMDFGGFPGLFPQTKGFEPTQVQGELWEMDDGDGTLDRLDALEGHPNWYRRTKIRVRYEDPNPGTCEGDLETTCEVYVLHNHKPHGTQCLDGIWPRQSKLQPA